MSRGFSTALSTRTRRSFTLFWAVFFVLSLALQYGSFALAAGTTVNLDQWANGSPPPTGEEWQNGNLNGNNSAYAEGLVIPFRLAIENLSAGQHTIHINHDFTAGGHKAYDFLATWDSTEGGLDACGVGGGGVSSLCGSLGAASTLAFPTDSFEGAPGKTVAGAVAQAGVGTDLTMYGGTIDKIDGLAHAGPLDGNSTTDMVVTFTVAQDTTGAALFLWGGHLAMSSYWDATPNGAGQISGAPWHMRTQELDGSGNKNQDRSIQPSALVVIETGNLTVTKTVTGAPQGWPGASFPVSVDCGAGGSFSDTIVYPSPGQLVFSNIVAGSVCTVTEGTRPAAPSGYSWGTVGYTGNPATISSGGNATVGITNPLSLLPAPALSLVKAATPSTYDAVGDSISYSYLVTNTGNVALAGPVTVADDKATVTCPAGGLTPGASMTCTATYTIAQADLESGSVKNTARASANGTNSNFDDETVTAVKNPALSITKVAREPSYSNVGDIIHYTIVATNTGNVTLESVTVTDASYIFTDLDCDPANPSSLAPGASITCTATHTVVQADIDAGHFANTACADDGEGGADKVCVSEDVPGDKTPGLAIDKTASPTSLPFGGGSVTYTYVVTNTGNVSLFRVELVDLITGSETMACSPIGAPVKTLGNQDDVLDVLPETWTYTCTKNITQTTNNTATVTAWTAKEGSENEGATKLTAFDSASVTVGQQPPPQLGSLTITKVVSPAEDFRGGTFKFDVSCATQQTITLAAGEGTKSVIINNLPLGASCTVTEVTPLTAGPGWQWIGQPSYAPGQTVSVPGTVTVTNTWGEVAAATATPRVTPPPTTAAGESTANPGSNLGLALAALALFGLVLGVLGPKPARARRRSR